MGKFEKVLALTCAVDTIRKAIEALSDIRIDIEQRDDMRNVIQSLKDIEHPVRKIAKETIVEYAKDIHQQEIKDELKQRVNAQ